MKRPEQVTYFNTPHTVNFDPPTLKKISENDLKRIFLLLSGTNVLSFKVY